LILPKANLCPDDVGFAHTSWRQSRHDGRFATMSSGLCPDDQLILEFPWINLINFRNIFAFIYQ
jgi:hypothetical protein